MAAHYCTQHNCKFFKNEKDGRVWYSHKIKGEDGYCNEPKSDAPEQAPGTPQLKSEISPQEKGMWWKEVGENFRCGLFKKDDVAGKQLWEAYVKQMLSSLEIVIEKRDKVVEAAKKMGAKES